MPLEFELFSGRQIGGNHPCFIIAEIGQNHQGDVNTALQLIKKAKECGVDCVKFQKSELSKKFNAAALQRPYDNPNSFGKTYGEHKKKLELSTEEFDRLKEYAAQIGIMFAASGMDEHSVDFLDSLGLPFFKVGSGDTNNIPYLIHTAQKQKPMIISTGMQSMATVKRVYSLVKPINDKFAFLQCTSAYPVSPENVNLNVIRSYLREFPDIPIGYSGHETGIAISIAAVAIGAKILERHFTLNKHWKGTDHCASLDANELKELVQQVRFVETALGSPEKYLLDCEVPCYTKLGKSVVAVHDMKEGDCLNQEMICVKVAEPTGINADEFDKIIGRKLKRDIKSDQSIREDDLV